MTETPKKPRETRGIRHAEAIAAWSTAVTVTALGATIIGAPKGVGYFFFALAAVAFVFGWLRYKGVGVRED
jgi:hypothetical protein